MLPWDMYPHFTFTLVNLRGVQGFAEDQQTSRHKNQNSNPSLETQTPALFASCLSPSATPPVPTLITKAYGAGWGGGCGGTAHHPLPPSRA